MKNAWIDETRSRARKPLVDGEGLADRIADPSVASAGQRDDAMAVTQALNQLPADQRVAVALVLVEGLSYAEAAEVLEIPAGTLTSRLVRGRTALMGLLEA